MKKKTKSRPINMTHHGPIRDIAPHGYWDFSENFCDVLLELHTRRILPKKRRQIKVFVSTIIDHGNNPERITLNKSYSFGYLCRLYIEWERKPFDIEAYKEQKGFRLEAYKKQGQKEMAWAGYNQYLHTSKLVQQEKILNSLPADQRETQRKKFEKQNGPVVIRIG